MAKKAGTKPKAHNFPKLHHAIRPDVNGLDTPLRLAAEAEVAGVRFDGVDLRLHSLDDAGLCLETWAEKAAARLVIGTVRAPVRQGGDALCDRDAYLAQIRKTCETAQKLRKLGVRPFGCVQIDTAIQVELWSKDPEGNQKALAETFSEACEIAAEFDEVLACAGTIRWGGMHSARRMVELLERVDRPQTLGFQADMADTLQYLFSPTAPEDRILPDDFDWNDKVAFDAAYKKMTNALRPWTVDLRIAQTDGTVLGRGEGHDNDKSARHCLPKDPDGKLDIPYYAGFWLRDEDGLTKRFLHICWDDDADQGEGQDWNDALEAMIAVRSRHGWK